MKSRKILGKPTTVDELAAIIEQFSFGTLDGMSFNSDDKSCKTGLSSVIYYAFEMFNFRQFYNPSNAMQFALAT